MKVLFYTYPSYLDTALPFVFSLSKFTELNLMLELSPEGWYSGIFDIPYNKLPSGVVNGKDKLLKYFPDRVINILDNVKSFHLVVHNNKRSISVSSLRFANKGFEFIKKNTPDIIHFDGISLRSALAIKQLKYFPLVMNVHDPEPHSGERNWRKTLAIKLTYPVINKFIVFNEFFKNDFCENHKIKKDDVVAVKFGVSNFLSILYQNNFKEENNTVLFFGRLSKYKGLDIFLKAIEIVAKKVSNCSFIIAGKPVKGYKIPEIPNIANGNKVELHIRYLHNKELSELFFRACIVVCPYLDATQSGVVLTAYAFNKPVIVTNVGGLPEYVWNEETGIIIPPGNVIELANAIYDLLTDKTKRKFMRERIKVINEEKLNWEIFTKNILEVYKQLIK